MGRDDSPLKGRMVFIVGARRSGTNWLQRIVGTHPGVADVPSETALFSRGIKPLRERFHHSVVASPGTGFVYMDRDAMLDALRDFCDQVFERFLTASSGAELLIERTPEHVGCLDVIGDIYPDATILHIIRDGRDVTRSLLSADWGPTSISDAAEEWRSAVAAARSAAPRLERYHEIRYEDLLRDPAEGVRSIHRWLGLPADDELLDRAVAEATVTFNVDPRSPTVGVGKWRESFSADDLADFNAIAGPLLADLGYEVAEGASRHDAPRPQGRSLVRRLFSTVARGGPADASALPREIRSRMIHAQRSLDRLLSLIAEARLDDVRAALASGVEVRLVAPGASWQGRGAEGAGRLIETLRAEAGLGAKQLSGSLHAGVPTSAAVMTYGLPDGSQEARILFVSIHEAAITHVSYYRLPIGSR